MSLVVCVCLVLASAATIVTANRHCRPIEISQCSKPAQIAIFDLRINFDHYIAGSINILPLVNGINGSSLRVTSQCDVRMFNGLYKVDLPPETDDFCDETSSEEPILIYNIIIKIQDLCPLKSGLTNVTGVELNRVKKDSDLMLDESLECRFKFTYGELTDCLYLKCKIENQRSLTLFRFG